MLKVQLVKEEVLNKDLKSSVLGFFFNGMKSSSSLSSFFTDGV